MATAPRWTELAYELPSGEVESIAFDAALRIGHDGRATVTEHPVEEGSDVSDHVRADNDRLTIDAVITNTPIVVPVSAVGSPQVGFDGVSMEPEAVTLDLPEPPLRLNVAGLVGAAIDLIRGKPEVTATVLAASGDFDRVRAVDARLRELKDTGSPVLVLTSLRDYDGMLITSYAAAKEGESLRVSLQLQKVRVVETQSVTAPPEQRPRRGRGAQRPRGATEEEGSRAADALSAGYSDGRNDLPFSPGGV